MCLARIILSWPCWLAAFYVLGAGIVAPVHGQSGICGPQWWYPSVPWGPPDDLSAAFGLPSDQAGGRTRLGVRFEAIGLDTLKGVSFLLYSQWTSSPPPDLVVEVWAADGVGTSCDLPTPGTLLHSLEVPGSALRFHFDTNYIVLPDLTFGTLGGGPSEYFFITISAATASEAAGLRTAIAAHPLGYPGCGSEMNSLAYFPEYDPDSLGSRGPHWLYMGDRFDQTFGHVEFVMEAQICAEDIPITATDCAAPGPDQWPAWAHDYQHTSASNIIVGDPNGITLAWTVRLPNLMNHCSPTVAGDIVYASSDRELSAFDLGTGALLGTVSGFPEMGSQNRGNTTIHDGAVYVTGGNFNALSRLTPDLGTFIWSHNSDSHWWQNDRNRFNTSIVVDIGGTDVVVFVTEPSSPGASGEKYAVNATDGSLYSGWTPNPVPLYRAGRHSPAYDGTNLYVGTGEPNLNNGRIQAFDAATGAWLWDFEDRPDPGDPGTWGGFPGGVSIEGDFIYATSRDLNGNGRRFKIDKSGAAPVVIWSHPQSASQYAAPTIGRDHLYIPQSNAPGVLMVDKATGNVVHNFADDGVARVVNMVALSCDNYLFVGDLNARWWVLNANTQQAEYYRQFPVTGGTVNGTALATHSNGDSYALVGVQAIDFSFVGQVLAYRLNAGTRPRLRQDVVSIELNVPPGSGAGLYHTEPDVFTNIGNEDLTFAGFEINDLTPQDVWVPDSGAGKYGIVEPLAVGGSGTDARSRARRSSKLKRMSRSGRATGKISGDEFTVADDNWYLRSYMEAARTSSRAQALAAAAATITRTTNVTVGGSALPVSLPPGGIAGLAWEYDGSGLGRGFDVEIINITNDDPDFDHTIGSSVASFEITYAGGCRVAGTTLLFNTSSPDDAGHHIETMTNYGALGRLEWDDDPINPRSIYDASFVLAGDSIAAPPPDGGPVIRTAFYGWNSLFAPNSIPGTGECGFDRQDSIYLGRYRTGGVPGTPVGIYGEMVRAHYSDTNLAADPGSRQAAIGVNVFQTEVGAYDPRYGDFKLIRWEIVNRDADAKGPLYAGSFVDWDVGWDNYYDNTGHYSDLVNGYYIWNAVTPGIAFGMLDPDQPSLYSGVDPIPNAPYRIRVSKAPQSWYRCVNFPGECDDAGLWHAVVNEQPLRQVGLTPIGDKTGLLIHPPFDLAPYASHAVHQALFGVDASANDSAQIEAEVVELAQRAARWGGFARGDVNEDGFVDLGDVLWLHLGYPIYPDDYCADVNIDGIVDQSDIAQLLAWASGDAAAQPRGEWRFSF